jgi:Tfp pilus assembly protein PilF
MFSDYGRQLLKSGIIDAKAGHRESARRYLDRAVYMSNDHDLLAEAWFWMSEVIDDAAEKRKALENCLAHDLRHARARKSLAILDGKLRADEIDTHAEALEEAR